MNPVRCRSAPAKQFDAGSEECPPASQIGVDYASLAGEGLLRSSIYNLVPPPGVAAQFAFSFSGTSVFLDAGIRSGGDNGITEHVDPVAQRKVVFNEATIWGVPGEPGRSEPRGEPGRNRS